MALEDPTLPRVRHGRGHEATKPTPNPLSGKVSTKGRFSAQRDMSSRHELSGRIGWGRVRVTFVRIHGGARPASAP